MLNCKYRRVAGFSLIELLIVIAIILIILAMALPKLNKARMQAFETGAIKAITTIHTAQAQYYSTFGKYADSLTALGPPTSGNPSASAADLISGDMASGEKGGYKYTMQPQKAYVRITGGTGDSPVRQSQVYKMIAVSLCY